MKIRSVLAILLALLVIAGLAGCNKATSPRDAVDRFAAAMNKNDYRTAFAYIADYDSFGFSDRTEEIMNAVASSMKIEYIGDSAGSTSATVEVKITTVDLREIYMDAAAEVIPEYFESAVSGKVISEGEVGDRLIDEVIERANQTYAPMVTTQLSLYLTTGDSGKWQIRLDTDAYYAITGYLDEANNLVTTGMIINAINSGNAGVVPPVVVPEVSSSDAPAEGEA